MFIIISLSLYMPRLSRVMAKSIGVHDIGGLEEEFGPIDTREYGYQLWEMQVIIS